MLFYGGDQMGYVTLDELKEFLDDEQKVLDTKKQFVKQQIERQRYRRVR